MLIKIKEWNKKWRGKIREILKKAEVNPDNIKSLKELTKNLKTPERIKALIDGLREDIKKAKKFRI